MRKCSARMFYCKKRDLQPQLSDCAVKYLEKHTNRSAQDIREEHAKFLEAYPNGKCVSIYYLPTIDKRSSIFFAS